MIATGQRIKLRGKAIGWSNGLMLLARRAMLTAPPPVYRYYMLVKPGVAFGAMVGGSVDARAHQDNPNGSRRRTDRAMGKRRIRKWRNGSENATICCYFRIFEFALDVEYDSSSLTLKLSSGRWLLATMVSRSEGLSRIGEKKTKLLG